MQDPQLQQFQHPLQLQEPRQPRELSDQELETVTGGGTGTGVSVSGYAHGGYFGIDRVYTRTSSFTLTEGKESVSLSVGVALAVAI